MQATPSAPKGSVDVVGVTCPALDTDGRSVCTAPIPWAELIASGLFGNHTDQALHIYQTEILAVRVREAASLCPCPGVCGRVVLATSPLTNATNAIECAQCQVFPTAYNCMFVFWVCDGCLAQVRFCFRCEGRWAEEHRPATCAHMLQWGASVFGRATPLSAHAAKVDDESHLSRMYIYRNTVGCPGMSVQPAVLCYA